MRIVLAGLLALALAGPSTAHDHESQPSGASEPIARGEGFVDYGLEPLPDGEAMPLAKALDGPLPDDRPGLYRGRIAKVCQTRGCWMTLSDGEQLARVFFGKHDFFLPKDTVGSAVVYGRLEQVEVDEAKAKHLAEDAGADPASITGPTREYRIRATSVRVLL